MGRQDRTGSGEEEGQGQMKNLKRKKATQNTLHLSKIATRQFGGATQHRSECTGCSHVSTYYTDPKLADMAAENHAKGMADKAAGGDVYPGRDHA